MEVGRRRPTQLDDIDFARPGFFGIGQANSAETAGVAKFGLRPGKSGRRHQRRRKKH